MKKLNVREHISNFQVGLFNSCPARYYEEYTRPRESGHIGAVFGSAIHDTIEEISLDAVANYDGRCYEYDLDYALEKFFNVVSKKYHILNEVGFHARAEDQLEYWLAEEEFRKAQVIKVKIGDQLRPAVELPFDKYLPNGIKIKGYIDRIEKNKWSSVSEVSPVDWKTGYIAEDYSIQMSIYYIACSFIIKDSSISDYSPIMYQLQGQYSKKYKFTREGLVEVYNNLLLSKNSIDNFSEQINRCNNDFELQRLLNSNSKINNYCHLCPRRSKCSLYAKELLCDIPLYNGEGDDAQAMYSIISLIAEKEKSLKKEKERINNMLLNHIRIKQENEEVIVSNGKKDKKLVLVRSERNKVDRKIIDLLIQLGVANNHCDISMSELKKVIDQFPQYEDMLNKFVFKSVSENERIKEEKV